jgi:hypothetical protein
MKKSVLEFFFVLGVVAILVSYRTSQTSNPEARIEPSPRTTPAFAGTPLRVGDAVPHFSLQNHLGEVMEYQAGDGPLFITLTATGCGQCLARIEKEDMSAFEMASKAGVDVWNMLVFHPHERAGSFVTQYSPSANQVMADPDSGVSVKMLGGSDSTCWLLIDGEGRLVYRAGVNLEALDSALAKL